MVANSDADVVFDRPFFRGGPDPLSTAENILYWNQEFRSTVWGHMFRQDFTCPVLLVALARRYLYGAVTL